MICPMDRDAVLAEIDAVLARFGATPDRPSPPVRTYEGGFGDIVGNNGEIASAVVACIERNSPHPSYIRMARDLTDGGKQSGAVIQRLTGVLASVRKDIAAGYLSTLEQRVREDVFDDFLDMADHIHDTTGMHPAPAVVLAVAVLEDHVRALAQRYGIETLKENGDARSFDNLVSDLAADPPREIGKSEAKLLRAWYGQRTDAAHGDFDKVTAENVPGLLTGVRAFIQQHPA